MALRKDPALRYASAEHLADDLFRHLEHLPVQARRGAWGYRASRFLLRHRRAVGAAALANLGDYQGALESYDTALTLLGAPDRPARWHEAVEPAVQQEPAALYERKGRVLTLLARPQEAGAALRDGLALAAAVVRQQPGNRMARMHLATLHGNLSDLLSAPGDLPASAVELNAALVLFEALAAEGTDDPDVGLSLASAYMRRAQAHMDDPPGGPDGERALHELGRAQQVLQRFSSTYPDNTSLVRARAFGDRRIGTVMLRLGRPREAARHTRRAAAAPAPREASHLYRQSLPLIQGSWEQMPRAPFDLKPEAMQAALQRCKKA